MIYIVPATRMHGLSVFKFVKIVIALLYYPLNTLYQFKMSHDFEDDYHSSQQFAYPELDFQIPFELDCQPAQSKPASPKEPAPGHNYSPYDFQQYPPCGFYAPAFNQAQQFFLEPQSEQNVGTTCNQFQSDISCENSETDSDDELPNARQSQRTSEKMPKQKNRIKKDPKRQIKVWTPDEDARLAQLCQTYQEDWKSIAKLMADRTVSQCKQHWRRIDPCYQKKKKKWTPEEDLFILEHVNQDKNVWAQLAQKLKTRTGKQIRDRYMNHLRPGIEKSRPWSEAEDQKLLELYEEHGPKWALLSTLLDGRSVTFEITSQQIMLKNRYQKLSKGPKLDTNIEDYIIQEDQQEHTCSKKESDKPSFNFAQISSQFSQNFSTMYEN